MYYHISTFGCQANKSDSERIDGDYRSRGYQEVTRWQDAQEIIINTCSVRQRAEDRIKGLLYNITTYFEAQGIPKPKIILTGCMLHHGMQKLKELLPEVDEILPISEVGFNIPAIRKDKTHAFVPISTGCNAFCTYCIVPYSRGREKSRNIKEIIIEISKLAIEGYSYVTLLGQNVNSYGLEKEGISLRKMLLSNQILPSNKSQYKKAKILPFVKLLQGVAKIKGITKIDFFSSNPWDFSDSLIDEIADNQKISRFLHLPVQSGSDRILKLMNRGYTRQNYLDLISKIRDKIPEVQFGTDIIVGFPTESNTDFEATVDLVNQIKFPVGFVAQYSPRPGTVASRLYPDDVSPQIKKARFETLDKIINKDHLSSRPLIP